MNEGNVGILWKLVDLNLTQLYQGTKKSKAAGVNTSKYILNKHTEKSGWNTHPRSGTQI